MSNPIVRLDDRGDDGHVTCVVNEPISDEQAQMGVLGMSKGEWRGLNQRRGGARHIAFNVEHEEKVRIGDCINTFVDKPRGKAELLATLRVDKRTAQGKQAWQDITAGKYQHVSWSVHMRQGDDAANPGKRVYIKRVPEISLVTKPAYPGAEIRSFCSLYTPDDDDAAAETAAVASETKKEEKQVASSSLSVPVAQEQVPQQPPAQEQAKPPEQAPAVVQEQVRTPPPEQALPPQLQVATPPAQQVVTPPAPQQQPIVSLPPAPQQMDVDTTTTPPAQAAPATTPAPTPAAAPSNSLSVVAAEAARQNEQLQQEIAKLRAQAEAAESDAKQWRAEQERKAVEESARREAYIKAQKERVAKLLPVLKDISEATKAPGDTDMKFGDTEAQILDEMATHPNGSLFFNILQNLADKATTLQTETKKAVDAMKPIAAQASVKRARDEQEPPLRKKVVDEEKKAAAAAPASQQITPKQASILGLDRFSKQAAERSITAAATKVAAAAAAPVVPAEDVDIVAAQPSGVVIDTTGESFPDYSKLPQHERLMYEANEACRNGAVAVKCSAEEGNVIAPDYVWKCLNTRLSEHAQLFLASGFGKFAEGAAFLPVGFNRFNERGTGPRSVHDNPGRLWQAVGGPSLLSGLCA